MSDPKVSAVDDTVVGPAALLAGRYQLLGLLGVGGMGSVYRARDIELDEVVALKVLRRELIDSPGILPRFRQEVKLARRVTHPNVARTFDIGEDGGEKFLTMEYVDGESLAKVLAREGALSIGRALTVAARLCDALGAAHAAGVVHRDLKPDNVLLARDGRIVVTDFGVARAHLAGEAVKTSGFVGTPAYMAPEQVEGGVVDARADLYALGVVLFEMLTGRRAWPGDEPLPVAAARLLEPPPDPRGLRADLPDPLAAVVLRLLARRREERYADAAEAAAALAAVHTAMSTAGTPPPRPRPAAPPPAITAHGDKTVAVLPFRNMGPADDDYVADGLTEDLIDALSMTAGLRVRPRGAVMKLKGRDADPRELGRELDVQVVVEGSVRRAGASHRVTARLLSVADGFQLWAQRFDRPSAELLVVSDEVSRAIAAALTTERRAPVREAPTDGEAVELYLRARAELRRSWQDAEGMARAVELLDQALARAPDDPMVLAAAAMARGRLAFFPRPDAAQLTARAREIAERAVAGAPDQGDTWVGLATVQINAHEPIPAIQSLRRAVAVAPGSPKAHEMLGRMLVDADLLDEALRHLETALVLDPTNMEPRYDVARALALKGEWEQADAVAAVSHEGQTTMSGRAIQTRLHLWRFRERGPHGRIPTVSFSDAGAATMMQTFEWVAATGKLPREQQAFYERMAGALAAGSRLRATGFQLYSECTMACGETETALGHIATSVESGLFDQAWMDRCPLLAPLRSDPRWAPLREKVAARAAQIRAAYEEPLEAVGAGGRVSSSIVTDATRSRSGGSSGSKSEITS